MRRTSHYQLFDPSPYFSALALVRIPRRPWARLEKPADDDGFGTGFFVTAGGALLTAAHNLTKDGTTDGELLSWVWVCCFDHVTRDWTDSVKVQVAPSLVLPNLDAALLNVPLVKMIAPLRLGAHWDRGDSIAVLGFQPDDNHLSGFAVHWLPCSIPPTFPVAPLDLADGVREPALRLVPVDGALGAGISGGPALDTDCEGNPAIAVVKAEIEAIELRPAEVKTTAVRWIRRLLEQAPDGSEVSWAVSREPPERTAIRNQPGSVATSPALPRADETPQTIARDRTLPVVRQPGAIRRRARSLRAALLAAGGLVCGAAFLPAWNGLDADVVGPLATRTRDYIARGDSRDLRPLATDAVVRDGQGPVIELTRQFDPSAGESSFGRGWRIFVPFSLDADAADTTVILGNLIGPRRLKATNHASGETFFLTYGDRDSGESGYFAAGLEPFRRLAIQTNGGFYLEDDGDREVQFDPQLRPVAIDLGPEARWVYHYAAQRIAAIESLPERLELREGADSNEVGVIDRLDPVVLQFVREENGIRRYEAARSGRWSHATLSRLFAIRLHDRWGHEFIFDRPDRFIILDSAAGHIEEGAVAADNGITFAYDRTGRIARASIGGQGEIRYEYDSNDRLVAVVMPDGHRAEYGYDDTGTPYRKNSRRTIALRVLVMMAGLSLGLPALISAIRSFATRRGDHMRASAATEHQPSRADGPLV